MSDVDPDVSVEAAAYVDPSARLYGKISVGEGSSLWPYSVIRAECWEVRIGRFTNIQDFAMIHVGYGQGTVIGDHCSITHHCTVHGCTLGDNILIGINSTIMDGCVIGNNCIIGAHTLLSEGTVIPDNSVVVGVPGRVIKTRDNRVDNMINARLYHRNALAYGKNWHRAWQDPQPETVIARERAEIEAEGDPS